MKWSKLLVVGGASGKDRCGVRRSWDVIGNTFRSVVVESRGVDVVAVSMYVSVFVHRCVGRCVGIVGPVSGHVSFRSSACRNSSLLQ